MAGGALAGDQTCGAILGFEFSGLGPERVRKSFGCYGLRDGIVLGFESGSYSGPKACIFKALGAVLRLREIFVKAAAEGGESG